MKLGSESKSVERGGEQGKDRKFRIAATGKAFEILSSGLYKDHISAICRELGANAADSHIMAKKRDTRFEVHLPSAFEPFFAVKDFGVGLTEDQVNHFYTTYFSSDKTGSNDLTGCLGLGSKSPFSYTGSFTVTSITGGMKRIFTAFKDDGEPCITKMSEEATTECNGVEVRFAVNRDDFEEFKNKALEVYKWFNPLPIILGHDDSEFPHPNIVVRGDKWAFVKESYRREMSVVMGNVHYGVSSSQLGDKFMKSLDEVQTSLLQCGPILYVNIGECDITASRESLKFTDRTYNTLRKYLSEIIVDAEEQVKKEIAAAPSLWDARVCMYNLRQQQWLSAYLRQRRSIVWNGAVVDDIISVKPEGSKYGYVHVRFYKHEQTRVRGHGQQWRVTRQETDKIIATPFTRIYFQDTNKSCVSRIMWDLEKLPDGQESWVYLIGYQPQDEDDDGVAVYNGFIKHRQLAGVIKNASTLPEPPRQAFERRKTSQVLKLSPYVETGRPQDGWQSAEADMSELNVYVEVRGHEWSAGKLGSAQVPRSLKKIMQQVGLLSDIGPSDVIGVRSNFSNKVVKNPNWRRLDVFIQSILDNRKDLRRLVGLSRLWNSIGDAVNTPSTRSIRKYNLIRLAEHDGLRHTSPLYKLGAMLGKIYNETGQQANKEMHAYTELLKYDVNNVIIPKFDKQREVIEALFDQCEKRYALLSAGETISHRSDKTVSQFITYINAIDSQTRRTANLIAAGDIPAPEELEEAIA